MTTFAFTGHRPDKLGGYGDVTDRKLYDLAFNFIIKQPINSKYISGMALGWDTAVARVCVYIDLDWTAAVPFAGQADAWPQIARDRYYDLVTRCSRVQVISEGGYAPHKMHKRNEWMVDHCDILVALWNGSVGGTGSCVRYAQKKHVHIINLWDKWRAMR